MLARKSHCKRGHERTPENLAKDGHCKVCAKILVRKWEKEHPERTRTNGRKTQLTKLGWTPEMVEIARVTQNNCCAICRKQFTTTPHADHIHVKPPIPRGLLCHLCNLGIGTLQDSPEICDAAASYLRNKGYYEPPYVRPALEPILLQ